MDNFWVRDVPEEIYEKLQELAKKRKISVGKLAKRLILEELKIEKNVRRTKTQ